MGLNYTGKNKGARNVIISLGFGESDSVMTNTCKGDGFHRAWWCGGGN